MKTIQLIIVLLLVPSLLYAQRQGKDLVDSMERRLQLSHEDTGKVKLLADVSLAYKIINAGKGIKYGKQGLELASHLHWKKGMAMCHYSIGVNCAYVPDNPGAFENYIECLRLYEELNDLDGLAKANVVMGNVYAYYNDYLKAIGYYTKALTLYGQLGRQLDIAHCRAQLGDMYAGYGDEVKALGNLSEATKIFEQAGDVQNASRTTGMTGTILAGQKKYLAALDYERKAAAMAAQSGALYFNAINLCNIASCYLAIIGDTSAAGRAAMRQLAGSGAALRDEATQLFRKALAIAIQIRSLDVRYACYQNLMELAKTRGDYKEAVAYMSIYEGIKDTLYSRESASKVSEISVRHENDLKRLADSLKAAEKERVSGIELQKQRNYTYFSIGGVTLLMFVSFFVWKERGKSERERIKSENLAGQLGKSVLQKDLLMKEIHHRVKNNLQVISAMLELQLDIIHDAKAIEALTESTARVRSISLIHQQLYQVENISLIEFSQFTNDLFTQVAAIFNKTGNDIVLENNIDEKWEDIDTAVPLALILNELFTNSYKYGFANARSGSIGVSLERQDDGYHHLLYTDSGPGLPPEFKMEKTGTLGMRMIRNLSKQIGGRFFYEPDKKVFHITFKDLAERKTSE